MLFPNSYNKQGIQSNLPSYTPVNQGLVCAKVYPEGIQPIKGNNCGLIPDGRMIMKGCGTTFMVGKISAWSRVEPRRA